MTLTPFETEVLKYLGSVTALLLSGLTGGHIHKKRSSRAIVWDEEKDQDRRSVAHTHKSGGNGNYSKYMSRNECDLNHKLEQERWSNLKGLYKGMAEDIKQIKNGLNIG